MIMAKNEINNVKLGLFVLSGLCFLILLLYMIGRNQNLFQSNFELKTRMKNAQGLVRGNNVRYAGIEGGTVKNIQFINDSLIEVTMLIDEKLKNIIKKNAVASVGTVGLVGNKVLNIIPVSGYAEPANDGDVLVAKIPFTTDDAMDVLQNTSKELQIISGEIKLSLQKLNNSQGLWEILSDRSTPVQIRAAAANIATASKNASQLTGDLASITEKIERGEGNLGIILNDTVFASNINTAARQINNAALQADSLVNAMNALAKGLQYNVDSGTGLIHVLLQDSVIRNKLTSSMEHIEAGTEAFNTNMIALQHNFLLRGYFRKQARKNRMRDTITGNSIR